MAAPVLSPHEVCPTVTAEPLSGAERVDIEVDETTTSHGFAIIPGTARFGRAQADFKVKVPDSPSDQYAAFLAHGFGGIGEGYAGLGNCLAGMGKTVVEMDPPYSFSLLHAFEMVYIRHPESLSGRAIGATMRKVQLMDGLDIQGFDMVGHSYGGITGSQTAQRKAEYVRSMTFLASAGQYRQTLPTFAIRAAKFMLGEGPGIAEKVRPQRPLRTAVQMARYWSQPARRALEASAIVLSDVRPTATELKQNGIITAVVPFKNDAFFGEDQIRASMEPIVDVYEPHPNPTSGHGEPQRDPEAVAQTLMGVWEKVRQLRS